MNEVSCRVFEILNRPLEAKGITFAQIVEGTRVSAEKLRNKKERIDWTDYVAIMKNVRVHFTDAEYVEIGRSFMHSPALKFAFVVARLAFSPVDIYRWSNKPNDGLGNQMFTCVKPSYREVSPNELVVELTLPDGFEVCWDFFVIVSGNNIELPRLFGLPAAAVKLSRIPQGARMEITVPTWRVPLLKRFWRFVTRPFTARTAGRELKEAHETLIERFAQLEDARSKLDRQATHLRTAHTLNQLAQRDLDLERTLETLSQALVTEAAFAWAEIKLVDRIEIASAGERGEQAPLHRMLTARAGQVIGELMVGATEASDLEELLDLITPTLAIAIENAVYRTELERLVDQRTAELRHAHDQLAATIDQLRDAQGARERFFGNISHEIRTPLSLIMLAVGDIQTRAGKFLDARAGQSLGSVTEGARKLVRLVDELLLLAAGQENKLAVHREPTDVAGLVTQLGAAWRPAAEHGSLNLTVSAPESMVASVDPVAIERIASNLVSNAVKYTPRGGHVTIELADDPAGVRLSVLDTGPGIDGELASRLFGRFERGANDGRTIGTGIGLSLVKQLVEAHGGTISVVARELGGTEMRVVLPRLEVHDPVAPVRDLKLRVATPEGRITSGTRLHPPGLSAGTIVIAEDDAALAEATAQLLADRYTVIVGLDGEAALELVKTHQPQLLITDIDMPNLNGIELAKRFRELTGDRLAPIIMLSAVIDLGTRVAGLEAGAVDYVTKPFDPRELSARVDAQFRMRELAVRLHQAEQLSTLGILTSGLAHEIRNPANGIVNAIAPLTELLPRELTGPETGAGQLLEVMGECADQIGFLSRQLLGFRRGMDLELAPASIADLVQRSISVANGALTGVEVRTKLGVDRPVVCSGPLLVQALTNLVENAGHAAGPGGGWVEISTRIEGPRLLIEVTDSGPGVPVELRERIFEPFFTTKAPGVGTGLGLSVAKAIVLRHGGVLEIRERSGRPAFVIELPADSVHEAKRTRYDTGPRLA